MKRTPEPFRETDLEVSRELPVEVKAVRRVRARNEFFIHLGMYLAANVGIFIIWRMTEVRYPWFIWPLLGWGIGLVAHGLSLLFGPDSRGEERAVQRELARRRVAER